MAELAHWDSFCVIVGSSAGALIGLQFVVLTLIAERPSGGIDTGAAFGSPTIVHFCAVLLVSVLMRMPWHGATGAAIAMGLVGLAGVVYMALVIRLMHMQKGYKPQIEDWIFNATTPFVGYAVLTLSALAMPSHEGDALFGVAAAALVLLFTGIHNAWDAVMYHVFVTRMKK